MNNLEIWSRFDKPPVTALKQIGGGRLKGMTDINPQWRYKAMTDVFGPVGIGWCYEIKRLWLEDGVGGEKIAFAEIALTIKDGTMPIPGIGGSMLIANEKNGLHASDEAFKMATTDALSVALKMLGVGSAIYEGRWDGSKYRDEPSAPITPTTGIEHSLSEPEKEEVSNIASSMLDWITQGSVEDAVLTGENANLSSEQKIYLWTFFDSGQRSAMKKTVKAMREGAKV